jgi:heme A synthase
VLKILVKVRPVIAAGVAVVLLYGLLVLITGVKGRYCMYSYYAGCGDNSIAVCSMGSVRPQVFPIVFLPVLAKPVLESAGISFRVELPSSASTVHIVNAAFYFLTAVWFSGLFTWVRSSRRKAARGCLFMCAILFALLFCGVYWWMGYSWSYCYEPY